MVRSTITILVLYESEPNLVCYIGLPCLCPWLYLHCLDLHPTSASAPWLLQATTNSAICATHAWRHHRAPIPALSTSATNLGLPRLCPRLSQFHLILHPASALAPWLLPSTTDSASRWQHKIAATLKKNI